MIGELGAWLGKMGLNGKVDNVEEIEGGKERAGQEAEKK